MTDTPTKTSCAVDGPCGGLSYCLVAKAIISIAAIPLIAVMVASLFKDPAHQMAAAAYSGAATILIAQYIDRLRVFSPMVRKKN